MVKLNHGDCLEVLKTLENNSIDSLVTDPPAGISFMGKGWDHHKGGRKEWCAWMESIMRECHRVMKPGAHGLVWAIPRTSHWTVTACEDAGFQIRDVVTHLFGSGFPKSHNISKAIDKAAGINRAQSEPPATDAAKQWDGWGTALKPASEHWILIQKPISEKTIAKNVLKWGVGGLNIDGCRIGSANMPKPCTNNNIKNNSYASDNSERNRDTVYNPNPLGRFPANLVLSCSPNCTEEAHDMFDCPIALMDEQSGNLKSGNLSPGHKRGDGSNVVYGGGGGIIQKAYGGDSGGASRFFYCAKASKTDKNAGLEEMPEKVKRSAGGTTSSGKPSMVGRDRFGCITKNYHPTVKNTKLMEYLIKLITPPNGLVLDPFMGSGSTGVAAKREGFDFIGIEREKEYFDIAEKRIGVQK